MDIIIILIDINSFKIIHFIMKIGLGGIPARFMDINAFTHDLFWFVGWCGIDEIFSFLIISINAQMEDQ